MISRSVVLLALAGCTDDVPTSYAETNASVAIHLAPPSDGIPASLTHYRWKNVEAPTGRSLVAIETVHTSDLEVTAPARGIYVIDRWFVGQAAEQLTYHVVLTVDGVAPIAVATGSTEVPLGANASFDGRDSSSAEQRTLTYEWRLSLRPAGSMEDVGTMYTNPTLQLTPDVAGDYNVELRVFDGELWSAPAVVAFSAH